MVNGEISQREIDEYALIGLEAQRERLQLRIVELRRTLAASQLNTALDKRVLSDLGDGWLARKPLHWTQRPEHRRRMLRITRKMQAARRSK